jgi:hypothetical protein
MQSSHPSKPNPWTKLTALELTGILLFCPGLWIVVGVLSQFLPFPLAGCGVRIVDYGGGAEVSNYYPEKAANR